MIFGALSEYGIVLFIMFRKTVVIRKENNKITTPTRVGWSDGKQNVDGGVVLERKIDLISLILFPVAFTVFICSYFVTFKVLANNITTN